jgi:hypothetical protein
VIVHGEAMAEELALPAIGTAQTQRVPEQAVHRNLILILIHVHN